MDTIFGVRWPVATGPEYLIIFGLFLCLIFLVVLIRYNIYLKDKKINDYQYFLFKVKRLGLSNFHIKILNNMADILRLSNPSLLLDNPEYFESALGRFLTFLKEQKEREESASSICKDITIIYEKLYHNEFFRKPLEKIQEIETGQLLYFVTGSGNVYLGKITAKEDDTLSVMLFRNPRDIQKLSNAGEVKVYIWRVGDAEYEFSSEIISVINNEVVIGIPEHFKRDNEFRHPYLDVIIPTSVIKTEMKTMEGEDTSSGTMIKMNEYEIVVRINRKLDFKFQYLVEFNLMDFKINAKCSLIANKTIEDGALYYYTFKFNEMSEGAKRVLKRYIYEHL